MDKNEYRCTHCKKIVLRISDKQWIKSWCKEADRYVRLQIVKK